MIVNAKTDSWLVSNYPGCQRLCFVCVREKTVVKLWQRGVKHQVTGALSASLKAPVAEEWGL